MTPWLASELLIGSDIIRTAVSPTWDDIAQLAAIVALRVVIEYTLMHDVKEIKAPNVTDEESTQSYIRGAPDRAFMGSGEIFTVLFVTLGPMNVIKLFAWLSKDADPAFQRQLAVRAFLIATVALVLSAFVGTLLVGKVGHFDWRDCDRRCRSAFPHRRVHVSSFRRYRQTDFSPAGDCE